MSGTAVGILESPSLTLHPGVERWLVRALVMIPILGIVLGSISKQFTDHAAVGLGDEAGYYAWQLSWVTDADCDPTDDLRDINTFMFPDRVFHRGTWRTLDKYPTGISQLIVPFTLPAHGFVLTSNRLLGTHYREDGLSEIEVRTAWLAISGWCVLGVLALFAATRSVAGDMPAAIATCCVWAGTSAFAYTWKLPLWCHGASLATVSIAAYFVLARTTPRRIAAGDLVTAAGAGLCAGLAMTVRPTNVAVLLPLLLVLANRLRGAASFRLAAWASPALESTGRTEARGKPKWLNEERTSSPARSERWVRFHGTVRFVLTAAIACAIPLTVELITRKLAWGSFFFNGYAYKGEYFDWTAPHAWAVMFLFDTGMYASRGVFAQHPITIAAVMGLGWCVAKSESTETRVLALGWLIALVATIYLYGCWWFWNLGWSYGARWTADFAIAFAIGSALLIKHARARPLPALAFLLLLAAWSVLTCV